MSARQRASSIGEISRRITHSARITGAAVKASIARQPTGEIGSHVSQRQAATREAVAAVGSVSATIEQQGAPPPRSRATCGTRRRAPGR